ncbi:MAG: hypothetical protein M3174_07615, partial [Actinomycetota bacterium]|nr:hypothetical protein [Actinomycetota bacterium]
MGRIDPFYGYSIVLRTIVYGLVPLFLVWQYFRARRALHVFQLEGYKRRRFLEWCRSNRDRARFLRPMTAKKPLAMTGRAWRLLMTSLVLTTIAVLVIPGVLHISWGWPYDIGSWILMTAACFFRPSPSTGSGRRRHEPRSARDQQQVLVVRPGEAD